MLGTRPLPTVAASAHPSMETTIGASLQSAVAGVEWPMPISRVKAGAELPEPATSSIICLNIVDMETISM
jgi:hypothetical protein